MLTLFFVDDLPQGAGVRYEFNNDDAHHAIKVLRLSPGAVSYTHLTLPTNREV